MKNPSLSFSINIALLLSGLITVFSGLLMQVEYHIGNHGTIAVNDTVFGISYHGWRNMHKISIVILSLLMFFHIYSHRKWYSVVIKKRLFSKNSQVVSLSVIFVLVALTGLIPWMMDLYEENKMMRKVFIEIHDKLAIILTIYLILHLIKRLKWFIKTFEIVKKNSANK